MRAKLIVLDNDFEVEIRLTKKDMANRMIVPVTGLTGITYYISTRDNGTAIDPSLSIVLAERSAAPGIYYGTIPGTAVTAILTPYLDKAVFGICKYGSQLTTATPIIVRRSQMLG